MVSTTTVQQTPANGSSSELSVAIVGAGFAGVCMGIQLKKAGYNNFVIYEAANDIGGTWRENTYPGCACDIPSVLYCYSFEPYPWTQHYSSQPEILKYQHHCVDKYGLWPHIKLNTRVTAAEFDEGSGRWTVTAADGQQSKYRMVVLAQGGLSIPKTPEIPGLSSFPGTQFHSATWDHSCDLRGKRVAVIGTGASAIQIIPEVQPIVDKLVVLQRTPPWVLSRKARIPKFVHEAEKCSSWYNWFQRGWWFWFNELLVGRAMINNKQKILQQVEQLGLANLKKSIRDPELRQKLTPTFSVGCKRILASDDYYPALAQPNVQVIASGLKEVQGNTIIAEDGSSAEVDVIIFATGFDLPATLKSIDIKGPNNTSLAQTLGQKPEAFYGLAYAGFPNLFTIVGPNTGLGHNSIIYMIECAVNGIMQLAKRVDRSGSRWIAPKQEAQDRYNAEVQQRLKKSVWLSGCKSWYLDRVGNTESEGGSSILWPGLCIEYYRKTAWLSSSDWETAAAGAAAAAAPAVAAAESSAGELDSEKAKIL